VSLTRRWSAACSRNFSFNFSITILLMVVLGGMGNVWGVILVLMVLFRREGLLPESRTRLIMREPARTELEAVGADIEAAEAEEIRVIEESQEQLVAAEPASHDGGSS
jgi:branched-chain amino acid transport system permease protein